MRPAEHPSSKSLDHQDSSWDPANFPSRCFHPTPYHLSSATSIVLQARDVLKPWPNRPILGTSDQDQPQKELENTFQRIGKRKLVQVRPAAKHTQLQLKEGVSFEAWHSGLGTSGESISHPQACASAQGHCWDHGCTRGPRRFPHMGPQSHRRAVAVRI